MEGNVGKRLAGIIDEVTELEIIKAQVLYAKFQNTLKDSYDKKIKKIENDFVAKASLYGKSEMDCANEKNLIISQYQEQFQKIFDSRRLQYLNIQNEIAEMISNKLIDIANFKLIATNKSEFIKSPAYLDYLNKKEEFQNMVDTTLVHDEFDKYTKLLEELQDPLESYEKKLDDLADRYDNYDATIKECEKKLDECIKASLEDFDDIIQFIENSLVAAQKENSISKFLHKLFNKIGSNSKFQKNVVQKMHSEVSKIDQDMVENIDIIDEQTINLVAAIEEIKTSINEEFNSAME